MSNHIHMSGFVVELERKEVKNVNLRVYPGQGRVVVSYPRLFPKKAVEKFIIQKQSWITKKLNAEASTQKRREEALRDGIDTYLWGDSRRLTVIKSRHRHSVDSMTDEAIFIYTKYPTNHDKLEQALDDFYRMEIKNKLPDIIQKWEPEMRVQVSEFGVKKMKTRWGTCNIRAKRIWLNLHLAKWPLECLEFVVVHEMVHLLERTHSARFYGLMDTFLPDWRDREHLLKTFFTAQVA